MSMVKPVQYFNMYDHFVMKKIQAIKTKNMKSENQENLSERINKKKATSHWNGQLPRSEV